MKRILDLTLSPSFSVSRCLTLFRFLSLTLTLSLDLSLSLSACASLCLSHYFSLSLFPEVICLSFGLIRRIYNKLVESNIILTGGGGSQISESQISDV